MPARNANHVYNGNLTASTVDTVTLAQDLTEIVVLNRDTTAGNLLWVRVDGTDPTSAGPECYPVMPGLTLRLSTPQSVTEVRVIGQAAATSAYSVWGYQ